MYWFWVVSLAVAFYCGYHYRSLVNAVEFLVEAVNKLPHKEVEQESPSSVIDPDDPIAMAKFEHERAMKRLNPEERR